MSREEFLNQPGVKEKLEEIAKTHNFSVEDLLNVIKFETANTYETTIKNPNSPATGLIQFYPDKGQTYKTINGVKYEMEDIKNMSVLEQLDLVNSYFIENHTIGEHPYITVALPGKADSGLDDIIATPNDSIAKANPSWTDKDGNVTKRNILKNVLPEAEIDKYYSKNKTDESDDEQNMLPEVNIKIDKKSGENITEKSDNIDFVDVPEEDDRDEFAVRFKKQIEQGRDGTINNPFFIVPVKQAEEGKFYKNKEGIIYTFENGKYKLAGEYKGPEEKPVEEKEKEDVIVLDPKGQEQVITIEKTKPKQKTIDLGGEMEFVDVSESDDPDPVNTKEVLRQTNKETAETTDPTEDTPEKKSITDAIGGAASFADSAFTAASKVLDGIGGPGALVSYVLGKRALKDAMQEVQPQKRADLSPLFYEQYRQSKELAKKGFAPNEERVLRKRIDDAYKIGLENAVRGTAGNRARFLAQSGVLDSARSSALLNFAAQDDELRRQNQNQFTELMMFKENFDQQRSELQRAEDMKLQLQDKTAAGQFAAQAFSNVLSGMSGNNALLKRAFGNLQSGGLTPTSIFNS